jgi:cytochrome c-type biogenesis protein CcmH
MMQRLVLALATFLLALSPAMAVEPDEILKDPAQEARARSITRELRCVVCQNQSVDDSDAPLAKDMRVLVREQISAGASDAEVRAFLVARYGQYVLLRPPLGIDTALIWIGPFALFAVALGVALAYMRRLRGAGAAAPQGLSPEEEQQLADKLREPGS